MKKALKKAAEKPRQQKISFGIGLNVLANTLETDPEISHDSDGTRDDVSDKYLPGDIELKSQTFHPQISFKFKVPAWEGKIVHAKLIGSIKALRMVSHGYIIAVYSSVEKIMKNNDTIFSTITKNNEK